MIIVENIWEDTGGNNSKYTNPNNILINIARNNIINRDNNIKNCSVLKYQMHNNNNNIVENSNNLINKEVLSSSHSTENSNSILIPEHIIEAMKNTTNNINNNNNNNVDDVNNVVDENKKRKLSNISMNSSELHVIRKDNKEIMNQLIINATSKGILPPKPPPPLPLPLPLSSTTTSTIKKE